MTANNTLTLTHNQCRIQLLSGHTCQQQLHGLIMIFLSKNLRKKRTVGCNCLYDLTIIINDITPGNYAFTFIEPYRHDSDEIISFILGLNNEDSGLVTVDRNGYPWGNKNDE